MGVVMKLAIIGSRNLCVPNIEDYLPLEVEAYLLNRSGRDEIGYYAPLE